MASSRVALLVTALAWISLSGRAQDKQQQSEDDRIAVTVDSIWRTNEYPSEYRPKTFRVPSLGQEADFVIIHFTIVRVKNGHVKFPGRGGPGPRVVGNDEPCCGAMLEAMGHTGTPAPVVAARFCSRLRRSVGIFVAQQKRETLDGSLPPDCVGAIIHARAIPASI